MENSIQNIIKMQGNFKNIMKMEVKSFDTWTPYRELCSTVETCILKGDEEAFCTLQLTIEKYKSEFLNPYSNPPKNSKSLETLNKGLKEGINIPQLYFPMLSKEITEEAIVLSNMYNMDELVCLNLLCIAQNQMPNYPGLPRGLVAVLLYYDGHKSLISALRTIMQARSGFRWHTEIGSGIPALLAKFTDELVNEGLIENIIDVLNKMNINVELKMLSDSCALGSPKHKYTVTTLFQNIKQLLAEIVFLYSAQTGLRKQQLFVITKYLQNSDIETEGKEFDNVVFTVHMAFLFAIDVHRKEDIDKLPLINEENFLLDLFEELKLKINDWESVGLWAMSAFAFAVTIRNMRNTIPISLTKGEEEKLIEMCFTVNVFKFFASVYLRSDLIHKEEFFLLRLHGLITDFIVLLPAVVHELKVRNEEACKMADMYMRQSVRPPSYLNRQFEIFLMSFERLYVKDSLNLNVHLDYWFDDNTMFVSSVTCKTLSHQIALFKFISNTSQGLPTILFPAYLSVISSLVQCEKSAQQAFKFLKSNTSCSMNWNHFFESFHRYHENLRTENVHLTDVIYRPKPASLKAISPLEIRALRAVLKVTASIAEYDERSRLELFDNTTWSVVKVLFDLMSCSIHIALKAEMVITLAAFAKSESIAVSIWNTLESYQFIRTIPTTSRITQGSFQFELEQIECRSEEYPLTQAILKLIDALTNWPYPEELGNGTRPPGFDPYFSYVMNYVLLPFDSRPYKDGEEKWLIADLSINLFLKFLNDYEPEYTHFLSRSEAANHQVQRSSHPGFQIMVDMLTPGVFFHIVMYLIEEGLKLLEKFTTFHGKSPVDSVMLKCLRVINRTLLLQPAFLSFLNSSEASMMLTAFSVSIQGVNPRTNVPDYIPNIIKFVTFNSWLPNHTLEALKILVNLTYYRIDHTMILSIITSKAELNVGIRHGFVECLEAEEIVLCSDANESVIGEIKENVLTFMLQSLRVSGLNVSYYLLGFNLKSIKNTILQQAGYNESPRTCFHSILQLLNISLVCRKKKVKPFISSNLIKLIYKFLYTLCVNHLTSDSVLRFLRASKDVLQQQIVYLPFTMYDKFTEMDCMSWLLKMIAIEMRVLVNIGQVNKLRDMCTLLLSEPNETSIQVDDTAISRYSNYDAEVCNPVVKNCRLYNFVRLLNLVVSEPEAPAWRFLNPDSIPQLFRTCSDKRLNNHIDVSKLHEVVTEQFENQNLSAYNQRPFVMAEIKALLSYAHKLNNHRVDNEFVINFLDSYRQLLSIFFMVVPDNVLPFKMRFSLLVEIIVCLLQKVIEYGPLNLEVSFTVSEMLVLLFNDLKQSYQMQKNFSTDVDHQNKLQAFVQTFDSHMKQILKHICIWIINTSNNTKKIRVSLYTCLLMYFNWHLNYTDDDIISYKQLDDKMEWSLFRKRDISKLTCDTFNEELVEVLIKDVITTTNICQILSLSCLGMIVQIEPRWISHIVSRGYLKCLTKGIVESEPALTETLTPSATNMSPLYIYESKMAFLAKLASNASGANLILQERTLACLAAMNVFNQHPNTTFKSTESESAVPDVAQRYLMLFTPLLKLCQVLLLSPDGRREDGLVQISAIFLNHNETIMSVLQNGSPNLEMRFLKELADLTYIILSTFREVTLDRFRKRNQVSVGSVFEKIRKQMILLMIKFDLSHSSLDRLMNSESTERNLVVRAESQISYLKIILHLLLYAEKVVSESKINRFITRPLLEPIISDLTNEANVETGHREANIGIVVQYVINGVSHYSEEKKTAEKLEHQREKLSKMTVEEIKQLLPISEGGNLHEEYLRSEANIMTEKLIKLKKRELNTCYLIIETALFLLWSHLDYYMLQILPTKEIINDASNSSLNNVQMQEVPWKVSVKQINQLQEKLTVTFHDGFISQLKTLIEERCPSEKNYVEGLIRRIKRLLQFVPNK